METFRCCTKRYLRKELELFPTDWPIFAVGKETYKSLAFLYPEKTVIGLFHPTGSYGKYYTNLLDKIDKIPDKTAFRQSLNNKAVWLND